MVNRQKCMIIGAAPIKNNKVFEEFPVKDYFVICADGGYMNAKKYNITPNLVVGDFDSLKEPLPDSVRKVSLSVDKDMTDTMYAVSRAISAGFNDFVLAGCLGGKRFDHSFGALEVLQYIIEHGAVGVLADDKTRIIAVRDSRLSITKSKGAIISVFPFAGKSCNVTYYGLKFPLTAKTLTCGGMPMGVSNQIVEDTAQIVVHSGTALVMLHD